MDEPTVDYLRDQLALFDGGYEEVTATFRMHIKGTEHTAVVNLSIFETATSEPIAIQCPVITFTLGDEQEAAVQLGRAIRELHALLTPF